MPAIDATASTAHAAPATRPADDGFGKDAFMKLLVAQLRYQDPLNPADGAEFIAQTAQFQMVEKLEEISVQSAELRSSQQTLAASSLIGRTVTYLAADGLERTGPVDGALLTPDGPVLRVGTDEVPLAWIRQIRPGETGTDPTDATTT